MRCLACFVLIAGVVMASPALRAGAERGEKKEEGFRPLFNGVDLKGWKEYEGKPGNWVVEKDMLICKGQGGGWLGTEKDYDNFELRLEYRLLPAGNSGVYLRAPEKGWISRLGMEIQILDDAHPKYAKLKDWQYCGALYHVVGPSVKVTRPAGEWNEMRIRANGRQVTVTLNGKKIVDANLDKALEDPAIAKEHPGLKRTTGKIGLQSHSERVEFRNIRVREL